MAGKGGSKLPKGVGEVPKWWMELCPHDSFDSPEATARLHAAYEESQIFARVPDNFKQEYGGDDFPNWDPAEHGPMGDEMTKDWETKGYRRDPSSNKWVGKDGKPLEGRQFTIKPPAGYTPGKFGGGGGGGKWGGGLKSPSGGGAYANDNTAWEKPAWTTKKLRSTGKSPAGGAAPAPAPAPGAPTKTPGKIAAPAIFGGQKTSNANKPAAGKVGKPSWVK